MSAINEYALLQTLAYQAWLERGQPIGTPEIDWECARQRLQAMPNELAPSPSVVPPSSPSLTNRPRASRATKKAAEVPVEVPQQPSPTPSPPPTKARSRSGSATTNSKSHTYAKSHTVMN